MSIVAIAGSTFRLRVELESQAAPGTFKSSPTLAAGDVKILALPASPSGTEAFANSTNAPIALSGPTAEVVIAATETTAAGDGGELVVVWTDAAGDEWYSLSVHIQVKASDLALQGADGDTLETLSEQLALIAANGLGAGAIPFTYTLTSSGDGSPIADADVWVTSDSAGSNLLASGRTDQNGVVTFYLDSGTVYVWRQKSGWDFTNPDTEVVS